MTTAGMMKMVVSRPCRRTVVLVAAWTCFCWFMFRISNDDITVHAKVGVINQLTG